MSKATAIANLAAIAGIVSAHEVPKLNRGGVPRRMKAERKREKQHRKAKRTAITPSLIEMPASGRVYQQTAAGNLLRVDGKRGAKNRAKG